MPKEEPDSTRAWRPGDETEALLHRLADGEVSPEDAERVLEAAATPGAAQRVAEQRKLREAVGRAMASPQRAPAELRARIERMLDEQETAAKRSVEAAGAPVSERVRFEPSDGVVARIGRWVPAAVAALLLIGSLVVVSVGGLDRAEEPLSVTAVSRFAQRHDLCARHLDAMEAAPNLPGELQKLPAALTERFGQPVPGLDLSAIGYRFERVGRCTVPGQGAVHLVYRAMEPNGRDDAISLWMRAYDGNLPIEDGEVYTPGRSGDQTAPLLVWRRGDMVYYLIGDSSDAVSRAAGLLLASG